MSPRRGLALAPALVAVLSLSCLWGGAGAPAREVVDDTDVVAFAERVDSFYRSIEGRSFDTFAAFQDPHLRSHFRETSAFVDYYASLAHQLRGAAFRHTRPLSVTVEGFAFDSADAARVDVRIEGRHLRALRFWRIGVKRTDTWQRVGDTWFLTPEKL